MALTVEQRTKLNTIIGKMKANNEDDSSIREMVSQFKAKYDHPVEKPQMTQQEAISASYEVAPADTTGVYQDYKGTSGGRDLTWNDIVRGVKTIGKGVVKGFGQAVGEAANVAAAGAYSTLSLAPGDVPPTSPFKAYRMFADKGTPKDLQTKPGLESNTAAVSKFATKAAVGGGMSGGVLKGTTGVGPALVRGAVSNLPFVPKAFEEGGASGAALDIAINTAIDGVLYGAPKALKAAGILKLADADVDKAIQKGVSKGIKPTVIGKPSIKKLDKFYDDAKDAVRIISKRKDSINLTNEAGEAIARPRNAREFAEAIDQAKRLVYEDYHKLAQEAGDAGASFNFAPVRSELSKIIDPSNKKIPPKVREYAQQVLDEISELDGASPEIIEERIKDFNSSLVSYYSGRADKAKAQVDASVARLMREQLDKQITEATGPGYQELKNQYGALKSIEKEVAKRALVNARKANKSVFDLTDIFTGGDLVAGVVSGNPALLARGAFGRVLKESFKFLNDPDKAIDAMFGAAYRAADEAAGKSAGMYGKLKSSTRGLLRQ